MSQAPTYTREYMKSFIAQGVAVVGEHSYGSIAPRYFGAPGGYRIYVGKYCSIADRVEAFLGGYHRPDWVTMYPFPAFPIGKDVKDKATHSVARGDVVIGHDVWIGSRVTIMSGVRIGDGAVVGAEAVVTKDVPPYAIVAGNPARVVKYRFDEETIRDLLAIAWWYWPDHKVRETLPQLLSGDVAGFVASHRSQPAALTGA
jgi:acetyltransferase-like isoleucine patch superfamily enzyme